MLGTRMFYHLLFSYFRLKLIRMIFAKLMAHSKVKNSNLILNFLSFLEIFVSQIGYKKMRTK